MTYPSARLLIAALIAIAVVLIVVQAIVVDTASITSPIRGASIWGFWLALGLVATAASALIAKLVGESWLTQAGDPYREDNTDA